jgi:hypothetical protein
MIRFLGRLLFPRLPFDLQERKVNIVLTVLVISLLLGGFIVLVLVFSNKVGTR